MRHDIHSETLDALPVLGIGASQAGSSGIRNPNAMVNLIPGTYFIANAEVRVNGAPDNTQSFRIEGQDASNTGTPGVAAQTQPSVDAIQEIAIQTSNYAAEYGQVGGGMFNLTMKSGTNQFHGSAYEYFVNEDLNANQPFTDTAPPAQSPQRLRLHRRRPGLDSRKSITATTRHFSSSTGSSIREALGINTQLETVPTAAYRQGNLHAAMIGAVRSAPYPNGQSI